MIDHEPETGAPLSNNAVQIRYFSFFPYINAMEKDTGLGARQLVLILAGSFLIFIMSRKKRGPVEVTCGYLYS